MIAPAALFGLLVAGLALADGAAAQQVPATLRVTVMSGDSPLADALVRVDTAQRRTDAAGPKMAGGARAPPPEPADSYGLRTSRRTHSRSRS